MSGRDDGEFEIDPRGFLAAEEEDVDGDPELADPPVQPPIDTEP